jgi:hypothetical protein
VQEWLSQLRHSHGAESPAKGHGLAGQPSAAETKKCPLPDAAAVTARAAQLRSTLAEDFRQTSPEGLRALAAKLLKAADEARDDPVIRYACLREACDLALGAGDADAALAATDRLADGFDMKPLGDSPPPLTSGPLPRPLAAALKAADQMVATQELERLPPAMAVLERGLPVTKETQAGDAKVSVYLKNKLAKLREMQTTGPLCRAALAKLAQEPDHPDSNLLLGKFLCLLKGDWDNGLRHLARGSDPVLKAAAEAEAAKPVKPEDLAAVANAWWEAADRYTAPAFGAELREHACQLYEPLVEKLDGAAKTLVVERLRKQQEREAEALGREAERLEVARAKLLTEQDIEAEARNLIDAEYQKYAQLAEESKKRLGAAEEDLRKTCWTGRSPQNRYFDEVRFKREYTFLLQKENAILDPAWKPVEALRQQLVDKYSELLRRDAEVRPQYFSAGRAIARLYPKKH